MEGSNRLVLGPSVERRLRIARIGFSDRASESTLEEEGVGYVAAPAPGSPLAEENATSEGLRLFLAQLSEQGAARGERTHFLALVEDAPTNAGPDLLTSSAWSPSLRNVVLTSGFGVRPPPFAFLLGHGSAWHMVFTARDSPEDAWLCGLHHGAGLREFAEALIPTGEAGGSFVRGAALHLHGLDDEDRLLLASNAPIG